MFRIRSVSIRFDKILSNGTLCTALILTLAKKQALKHGPLERSTIKLHWTRVHFLYGAHPRARTHTHTKMCAIEKSVKCGAHLAWLFSFKPIKAMLESCFCKFTQRQCNALLHHSFHFIQRMHNMIFEYGLACEWKCSRLHSTAVCFHEIYF